VSTAYQRGSGRELFGLVIILVGFGLLMNTMNIFPFTFIGTIARFWWPAMFLGLGILVLTRSRGGHTGGGLFLLMLGTLFLLNQLDLGFRFGRMIGPAILIWLGTSMMIKRSRPHTSEYVPPEIPGSERFGSGAKFGMDNTVDSSDYIHATAVLGGFHRRCDSTQFRGGDLTAIMGGGKIDLRDAQMQGGEAVIDVFAVMGGMEIQVPMDWVVEQRFTPILGGYEDKTKRTVGSGKRLAIQGTTIMGGVSVTN
jgi:predicted membrane protein